MDMAFSSMAVTSLGMPRWTEDGHGVSMLAVGLAYALFCLCSRYFRRVEALDPARHRESWYRWHPFVAAIALIAALVALVAVSTMHRLSLGDAPPTALAIAVAWGAFLGAALLARLGLRLDRVDRAGRRLATACPAVVSAWPGPVHEITKPESPSEGHLD
ncbi:hypothetical protein [Paludisphaera sp.]|uniref:hypothetical protein n=1 Tax=Paludisphaera sp. TaxID=2017432 RepID=UPI00301C3908